MPAPEVPPARSKSPGPLPGHARVPVRPGVRVSKAPTPVQGQGVVIVPGRTAPESLTGRVAGRRPALGLKRPI